MNSHSVIYVALIVGFLVVLLLVIYDSQHIRYPDYLVWGIICIVFVLLVLSILAAAFPNKV
jgi:uncharacterized membrane protein YjfL (UPF0719 family)